MPSRLARRTLFLAALSLVLSLALSDSSAEVSVFLEELSSAASDPFSVSVSLSCDCGQTKCNCLKVCECKLPAEVSGAQVRAGGSGPPRAAARPRRPKGNAAARGAARRGGAWQGSWQHEAGAGWQPASARELEASDAEGGAAAPAAAASFLQAEMHPGLNQPMECDCEKCKCTCLRHCACDSGTVTQAGEAFVHGHDTAAAAAQAHLQMHAGAGAPEEPPQPTGLADAPGGPAAVNATAAAPAQPGPAAGALQPGKL